MQSLDYAACPECLKALVDAGDEFVCEGCGLVRPKETLECGATSPARESTLGAEGLGSYMGTASITARERASRGLAGSNSRYEYLKILSDFAGREEGAAESCQKMIDRIGEKLVLPRFVLDEARGIARTVLNSKHRRRINVATASAYSLISACKVEGVASVSVREIIAAHLALGRKVRSSSIIQLSLESPIRTFARRPEDYLSRVLARLSLDGKLTKELEAEGVPRTSYFNKLREASKEVLKAADRDAMAGRRPCALAASAIYTAEVALALRESRRKRLTQRELAECGDAAEYTIREQCARIFEPTVGPVAERRRIPALEAAR